MMDMMDRETTQPTRAYTLVAWAMAIVSIAILLPYVALAIYGFPTLDDVVLYSRVKEDGLLPTVRWYYEVVSGRIPAFLIHGGIAGIIDFLGGNPRAWLRGSALIYFGLMCCSLGLLFKTIMPRLRWPLVIVLATVALAAVMPFHDPLNRSDPILSGAASQQLWPFVLAIYGVSFAMYVVFLASFVIFLDKETWRRSFAFLLCGIGFVYSLSHEITVIPFGLFLILVTFVTLDFGARGRPVSVIFPLSCVRVGVAVRANFDNKIFLSALLALGICVCLAASIHLLSPSVDARAGYWPAKMTVWHAVGIAFSTLFSLLGEMSSPQKPFYWLMFFLVFFVARTTPLRGSLVGMNRHILLIPVVMFVALVVVSGTVSLIMLGGIILRVKHYMLSYGMIAVVCLAVYLANGTGLPWLKQKMAAALSVAVFLSLVAVFAADPWYRMAVDVAVNDGYQFSKGTAERVAELSRGRNRVVTIRELEPPPPFVQPVIHWADTELYFQSLLARSFGQQKVNFLPCAKSAKPNVCHYLARSKLGPVPH